MSLEELKERQEKNKIEIEALEKTIQEYKREISEKTKEIKEGLELIEDQINS